MVCSWPHSTATRRSFTPRSSIVWRLEDFEEGPSGPSGAYSTTSAVELAARDGDTAARVSANLSRLEEALCAAVRTAQADGELSSRHDARTLARFLLSSLQGLRVMGMASHDRNVLRDVARVTLSMLD
jgi:TetR/AcrR family transcriptional repressor of nem operon